MAAAVAEVAEEVRSGVQGYHSALGHPAGRNSRRVQLLATARALAAPAASAERRLPSGILRRPAGCMDRGRPELQRKASAVFALR